MRDGAAIASALDGYRSGKGWKFRCPIHNDNTPSASIRDDGLVTCFAGCARAEVCARLDELGFVDDESKSTVSPEDIVANEAQRIAAARQMWTDALDDAPYIASYLKSRGVTVAVPPIMKRWRRGFITPLQLLDGTITAVHTKVSYGKGLNWGAMRGGAVQLAPPLNGEIGLAESVFDALSATQITGVPCWSVCGAPRLGSIDLPADVERVTLFSDNDEAGRAAAQNAKQDYRWRGFAARIWAPPNDVKDFNEELMRRINRGR